MEIINNWIQKNYGNYLREKLISNFQSHSVIEVDNKPRHNTLEALTLKQQKVWDD